MQCRTALSRRGVTKMAAPRAQYERDNDSWRKMQHLVMQLRKCCNHPYLFPGAEPDFDGQSTGARQGLLAAVAQQALHVCQHAGAMQPMISPGLWSPPLRWHTLRREPATDARRRGPASW